MHGLVGLIIIMTIVGFNGLVNVACWTGNLAHMAWIIRKEIRYVRQASLIHVA